VLESAALDVERPWAGKIQLPEAPPAKPFVAGDHVGYYLQMKLHHLGGEQIHARATGPNRS